MNIVFAFADDWGRYASAYAKYEGALSPNNLINTPNFDRIASEGALFTNAFVPAPSCTPCRSSVLSGRYFWQTGLGAILQGAHWDENIPTYPLELEKNGWHIGYTYKVWCPGDNPNQPYGGDRTQYYKGLQTDNFDLRHFGLYGKFSIEATKNLDKMSVDESKEIMYTETRDSFKLFLEDRNKNQPFCYWWGPVNTHRPWKKGSGEKLWGLNPDDLKGKLPDSLPDVPEIREDFCDYLGECLAVDAGLGVLIEELENIGELDNTLIVVSGDHGIPGMPRGKCNLYDLGSQVALAMRCPSLIKDGTVIDDFVNLMNLTPTFLDFANVPTPEGVAGKSLIPMMKGEYNCDDYDDFVVIGRERHVDTAREGNLPYPQRAIRTKDFLYIVNFEPEREPMGDPCGLDVDLELDFIELCKSGARPYADLDGGPTKNYMCNHRKDEYINPFFTLGFGKRPYEELFEIKNDIYNVKNIADDPNYSQIKNELSQKLFDILKKENDPRVCESPCRFEMSPYTDTI